MKAPDKIYIDIIEDEYGYLFSESLQDNGGKVYIRKDALLEWAKQKQFDSLTIVQDNFWQEVIDKLNDM